MSPSVDVAQLRGRWVVVLSATAADRIGALVEQAHAHRLRAGMSPLVEVPEVVRACRRAHALARLLPRGEAGDAEPADVSAGWLGTGQAAEALGITPRAVRQRIAAGRLPAVRVGDRWLLDPREVT